METRGYTLPLLTVLALCIWTLGCGRSVNDAGVALPADYEAEIGAWRSERDDSLARSDGWLTLVGLYWLEEGSSTFGSDPESDLVFPPGAPERMGVLRLTDGLVEVEVDHGVEILHEGSVVERLPLAVDTTGNPTLLTADSLTLHAIERDGRIGIRVKDSASPLLASFQGMEHYPIDPDLRLTARFEAYDPPKGIEIPNVLGTVSRQSCPGALVLEIDGESYRLEPTGDPGEPLFLVFGDATNGHGTYGGGRFLYTAAPAGDGTVIVDFNKAYNPPCVFTPFATCPLPAPQNKLPIALEAGEKVWGAH